MVGAALSLAACGTSGAGATATTRSSTTTTIVAGSASSSTTNPQTGGYNPGDNAIGPAPGGSQPGGDPTARAYLAQKGWINPAGQVVAQAFNLNGNGQSDDQAFCTYVFGTLEQIAKTSQISTTPASFDDNNSGSQGDGTILCAYNPLGQSGDVLGMGVGNTKALASTAAGGKDVVTVPASRTNEILLAYDPQYGGPAMTPAAAKAWLGAALARVDFSGLTDT